MGLEKKTWGKWLTITPIILWLVIALINGFNFNSCWMACKVDNAFIMLFIVSIVIGIGLWMVGDE